MTKQLKYLQFPYIKQKIMPISQTFKTNQAVLPIIRCGSSILLRKIALPYPHKCLLSFVEAKRGDQQEYLKIILVREVNPVVSDRCACAQHIVGWTLSRDPHSIFGRRGGCAFFFGRSSWRSHS